GPRRSRPPRPVRALLRARRPLEEPRLPVSGAREAQRLASRLARPGRSPHALPERAPARARREGLHDPRPGPERSLEGPLSEPAAKKASPRRERLVPLVASWLAYGTSFVCFVVAGQMFTTRVAEMFEVMNIELPYVTEFALTHARGL